MSVDRIIEKISSSSSAAILAHDSEDADALGSALAMEALLESLGKSARIYLSEEPEQRLRFLKEDMTVFDGSFSREHDLCICLDCGDKKRLGRRKVIFEACPSTVSIDHHYTNERFADENYVDGTASATAEILWELFEKMGVSVDKKMAEYLYAAIVSDSGCFKYNSVTPKTMRIAAELLERGIDHAEICRRLFDIKPIEEIKFAAEAALSMESFAGGKVTVIAPEEDVYNKYGIRPGDEGDIVNTARMVKGTEIAVHLKRRDGGIKVSLRSAGRADVSGIAVSLGGGGHKMAAGAYLADTGMEEAKARVIDLCERAADEL